jgi:hypothetical protein
MSEGEYEALMEVTMAQHDNGQEEVDKVLCDHDASQALVLTKVLTMQAQSHENQRYNIIQTCAEINGKSIKMIIDGGSYHNLASTELCEKLNLTLNKHSNPYHVQWLSDKGNINIQHTT